MLQTEGHPDETPLKKHQNTYKIRAMKDEPSTCLLSLSLSLGLQTLGIFRVGSSKKRVRHVSLSVPAAP